MRNTCVTQMAEPSQNWQINPKQLNTSHIKNQELQIHDALNTCYNYCKYCSELYVDKRTSEPAKLYLGFRDTLCILGGKVILNAKL